MIMKKLLFHWVLLLALFGGFPANAKSAKALIKLKDKPPQSGYLVSATVKTISFSQSAGGQGARSYPRDMIEDIRVTPPVEWTKAEKLWSAGSYSAAQRIYAQIRNDYYDLLPLVGEFPSLAAFRETECLRYMEKWTELRKRAALLKKEHYEPGYQAKIAMYDLWDSYASVRASKKGIERLEALVRPFRSSKNSLDVMAQAAFISGYVHEFRGDDVEALSDYHRACTLNLGRDQKLSLQAMEAALKIYAADEDIEDNRVKLREAHGIGQIYAGLNPGKIDRSIKKFTEPLAGAAQAENEQKAIVKKEARIKARPGMKVYIFRGMTFEHPDSWTSVHKPPVGSSAYGDPKFLASYEYNSESDLEAWVEKKVTGFEESFGLKEMSKAKQSTINGLDTVSVTFKSTVPGFNGKKAPHLVTLCAYKTPRGIRAVWLIGPENPSAEEQEIAGALIASGKLAE